MLLPGGLGWVAAWVQRVARRVDKTAHDRYRLVGTKERAASGSPLHSQHRCAGVARPEEEAHADEQAERVRRWPRRLPYGFASRKVAVVFDGLFLCSVAFLPTLPWEALWYGVAEWMGIEPSQMGELLPNAQNFVVGDTLLNRTQLFGSAV